MMKTLIALGTTLFEPTFESLIRLSWWQKYFRYIPDILSQTVFAMKLFARCFAVQILLNLIEHLVTNCFLSDHIASLSKPTS